MNSRAKMIWAAGLVLGLAGTFALPCGCKGPEPAVTVGTTRPEAVGITVVFAQEPSREAVEQLVGIGAERIGDREWAVRRWDFRDRKQGWALQVCLREGGVVKSAARSESGPYLRRGSKTARSESGPYLK
jgi:hypothetical protein